MNTKLNAPPPPPYTINITITRLRSVAVAVIRPPPHPTSDRVMVQANRISPPAVGFHVTPKPHS